MKIAICDSRIPKAALDNLSHYCDNIVLLPKFEALAPPVSAHPDILIFPLADKGYILTHREYLLYAQEAFAGIDLDIIPISEKAGDVYPRDILLNAAVVGEHLFGKLDHLSKSVLNSGFKNINVNQGYARCSTLSVNERALITSDKGIAKAAKKENLDVLLIEPGYVELDGYDYGFIGGAGGYDNENVYFCGNVQTHPDADKIIDFCLSHGKTPISLASSPLYDVGTIFFLYL
ncbi:MAG: hypothetical protein IKT56_06015 [Clostridia bacterium]|nr:hypothetical protein [Clostridia bacterium]